MQTHSDPMAEKVVVFDYGQVISLGHSHVDHQEIERTADVDPDELWTSYRRYRNELDHGQLGSADFWRRIGADVGAAWSDSVIHSLWNQDLRAWSRLNEDVLDIVSILHKRGTRLALLSNAARDLGAAFRSGPLGDYFTHFYVSSELGLLKPDPQIFTHVAADLQKPTSSLVFIDDKQKNVDVAQELGYLAHRFVDPDSLREYLESVL